MRFVRTPWAYDTAEGGAIALSVGVVGGGLAAGALYFRHAQTQLQIQLTYAGGGVGVGRGLPFSISGATTQTPSSGIGCVYAINRPSVRIEDFEGLGLIIDLSGGIVYEGRSLVGVYLGCHPASFSEALGEATHNPVGLIINPYQILFQARALVRYYGVWYGVSAGASLMGYPVGVNRTG